jgi:hypothetical protein
MAGKSGKRITGKKPAGSTRTSAMTTGAFGKEGDDRVKEGAELNRDKGAVKTRKAGGR